MASLLDEWAREETTATTAGLDAYGRGAGGGDNLLLDDEDFDDEFDDGIDFGGGDDGTEGVHVGGPAGSSFSSGRQQQQQSDMFSLDVVEREVAR